MTSRIVYVSTIVSGVAVERVVVGRGGRAAVIGTAEPTLSWRVAAGPRDWLQAAYEIRIERSDGSVDVTGRVAAAASAFVQWPFRPLESRERGDVSVRVYGTDESESDWSVPAPVEAGLLAASDWHGSFVGPAPDPGFRGALYLRRSFVVDRPITRARLYVAALGIFEPYVNGEIVGDHVLDPGWTSYDHRILYSAFDVTERLRQGANVLGAIVADGWYRGRIGFNGGRRELYGDRVGILAQLELTHGDGSVTTVVSDADWQAQLGPITEAELYDGETYDARRELDNWSAPAYDASDWIAVSEIPSSARLEATETPARRTQTIAPVAVLRRTGVIRLDFGQNLVGRIRFVAQGAPGATVALRHAEVLENDELALRPLRTARSTDVYTLRGGAPEAYEPRFTFHGFRYAELSGAVEAIDVDSIRAVVIHSDLERTGWFECSEPDLNRLHENIVWSMRGNVVTLPTDCPQRDERLGWTGDAQVFGPTACFLYDANAFLASWLSDLMAEQTPDGAVPNIVPTLYPKVKGQLPDHEAAAAWADAAVIVPWTLYEQYGDTTILATHVESMRRWVDHVESRLSDDGTWDSGWQYGDWLDPAAPPDAPWDALTETALVATAYAARTAALLGRAADALGDRDQAESAYERAARRREAFVRRFVLDGGRLTSDAQTAYALALAFGLVDDAEWNAHAAQRLAELVQENRYRIGTGFVGTPIICDALSRTGHADVALRLVLERGCPSWLYPITMGATTMWERWDSMLPDGSVNPGKMTSFNHYAFGAIGDWLHRVLAGLAPAEPGYRRLRIEPCPGAGITYARAVLRTPYGTAESSWRHQQGRFVLSVVVPPNTHAEVRMPGESVVEVGSGDHTFETGLEQT